MYDQKVLEDLAEAIEGLDILPGGEDLVAAIALRNQLDARIAEATAAFESAGWWGGDASVSMVAWLRAHARMTRRSAQRLHTLARRLRLLPVCAGAMPTARFPEARSKPLSLGWMTRRRRYSPLRKGLWSPASFR